ncbi:MAG: RodZ domain-containing protein [Marmoricola sp.]
MSVSVRHNSRLAAFVALAAAVMTVAWFSRALQSGSLADWGWCVVVAAVGLVQLLVLRDGRAPLMVADEHGVRVRHGETWSGLRWQDIEHVEVQAPASWMRDGQIVVHPSPGDVTEESPEAAKAYVVRLGRTTSVDFDGLSGDLVTELDALASGRVPVLVLTRVEEQGSEKLGADRSPAEASAIVDVAPNAEAEDVEEAEPEFELVAPAREPRTAARSEVVRDAVRMPPNPPAIPAQRAADRPVVVARLDDVVGTGPRPASEAVIGPLIAAARNRARLSIDTLSERTRIRPHVLESIEVDDFEVCGGDFYARGHLRTLARIFGLDPQQLLDLYDDHYATAEIEARQVFEAELATGIGGGVRATHMGPRWTLLAACVLALVGVWGVARIFNDTPQELVSPAPNVVDSAGLAKADPAQAPKTTLAPLEVTAVGASPQVVVRDRDGRILWAGKLSAGQRQQVIGLAPFDVTSSNGAAVKVSFLGKAKGAAGPSGAAASKQFG